MADLFDFIDAPAEKKTGDIFDSLGGTPDYVPPEIAQSEAQQAIEQNFRAPQWANNAAEALQGTLGGFVPRSMHDVAGLLTPATGSIDEVIKAARIAKDVANGATPEEATRRHSPESFQLADAEQTPPYSKERFQAGFDTVAQMLMAAGIAKGHAKAGEVPKGDNLKQESGTPLMTAESQMVSPDTSSRTTEPTVQSPAAIQEPSAIRSQPVPQSDVNTPSVEPSTNQNQGIKEPQAESGATGQAAFEANLLHGSPNPNLSEVSSAPSLRQYDNATSVFGAFFTARPNEAANYAGKGGKVYPVRVRIDNPKEMRWNEFAYFQDIVKDAKGKSLPGEQWGARADELKQEALALRQQLEAEGYDGIVVRDTRGQPIEVASFKNVKIDTGTASGLKSPQSSSINEGRQRGPATSESAQPQPASRGEASSVSDAPAANPQGEFPPKANPEPQPASDTTGQTTRFVPSTEWQEVPPGTVLPNGGEYRMDQKSGKNFARWTKENLPDNTIPRSDTPTGTVLEPERSTSEGVSSRPENTPTGDEPSRVGITHAAIDEARQQRNLSPIEKLARDDLGETWDATKERIASDPEAGKRLAESLQESPRALDNDDVALLLHRTVEAKTEFDAATEALNRTPGDPAAMARLDRARESYDTVQTAIKHGASKTGKGLRALQQIANDDYSLAKMEATTRAVVNNGRALTERQAADVKTLHERIRAAEEKVSAYEAREQFETELRKAKAEARKTGFRPQSFLEQQAQRARERIISRRGKLHADPIGITQVAHLADEAIIGASHIARGITKFADWSAQMIADFGERIKPHLQALYAKARELHSQAQISQPLTGRSDMLSRTAAGESRFERQLGGDKKRIQANIENIQAKTATGDFSRPEKQPPRMDKQKAALLFEFQKAKEAYNKGLIEAQLAKQSIPRKALRYGGEMLNTTRALMTSFDLSAVLRQGGFIAFGHPLRALRAFPDMISALRSEKNQFRVMEDIKNRPNAPLYQQSKLYISDQGPGVSLSKMEEQYMSRWARHIPGVGASERAYTTFLNRLRADSFDAMAENLGRRGKVTLDEAKAIANFVNVATGRGNLDAAAKAATGLNTFFFAPRYVVSRFQLLAGQPLMRGSFRTRGLIAKEYGRTLAGAAVVYALGQSAGATIDTDSTSPDFLKLKFGNTRVDPLFGLTQASVFLSREALALKRFVTQDQSKPPKYGTGGEVLGRFLRSKLAPAIGGAVDALSGKNVVGQKVTPASVAQQLVVPLSFGDIYNAMKDQGVPRGTILGILAIFGMGVQNYAPKPDMPHRSNRTRSLRQAMDERRLDAMARDLQAA